MRRAARTRTEATPIRRLLDAEAVEHVLVAPPVAPHPHAQVEVDLGVELRSSERRAAVPISPILAPPLPIRIPFWDSVSAQISALTVTRPSSRGALTSSTETSTECGISWRVRFSTCSRISSASSSSLGLVGGVLRRIHVRALGDQLAEPVEQLLEPLAVAGADREDLVDGGQRGRLGERVDRAAAGDPVALVDRADHRDLDPRRFQQAGDEAVAGPDALLAVDHQQRHVGVGQLALDPLLHPFGQRVAGRCTPGRSTRISCRSASRSVATPRIARRVVCGRTETIATWLPTRALTRVDLPTLGRPARPTNPERVAHRQRPARTLVLEGEHLAVVGLVVVAAEVEDAVDDGLVQRHVDAVLGADRDVAELARAGRGAEFVDREGEHVGRGVLAAVVAVQLLDPRGVDDLHREMTVVDPDRGERRGDRLAQLGGHVRQVDSAPCSS